MQDACLLPYTALMRGHDVEPPALMQPVHFGVPRLLNALQVSSRAKKRGLPQLGTLGAGNHYAEVQVSGVSGSARVGQPGTSTPGTGQLVLLTAACMQRLCICLKLFHPRDVCAQIRMSHIRAHAKRCSCAASYPTLLAPPPTPPCRWWMKCLMKWLHARWALTERGRSVCKGIPSNA